MQYVHCGGNGQSDHDFPSTGILRYSHSLISNRKSAWNKIQGPVLVDLAICKSLNEQEQDLEMPPSDGKLQEKPRKKWEHTFLAVFCFHKYGNNQQSGL